MFEDSTHFDFDDVLLGTSFTPAPSSTQTSHTGQVQKRNKVEPVQEDLKRQKLSQNEEKFPECPSPHQRTKIKDFTYSPPNRCVKRKFPGPAGLLPERMESNKSISELIANEDSANTADSGDEMIFCSQRTNSTFEGGPWKEMTKDFYMCNGECLYEKFNINWIKKQASLKKLLVNHKAPFLAAIIQSLEISDGKVPTVNVTLKDATGDIQGTILYSLYEEYANFFTLGSVLVLKQFGVLSAGYNNHCLTITPNNLLTIYCLEVPKKPPETTSEESSNVRSSSVKKVVIQEYVLEEILKKYNADVLANSDQRRRSISFGKLNQNYDRLSRNNSGSENCNTNKFVFASTFKNQMTQKPSSNILPFQNVLKRSASVNNESIVPNIPLRSLNAVPNHDNVKKKFNFKESVKLNDNSKITISSNVQSTTDQADRSENTNSDNIVISSSQISIRPDNKEHTDIWKNLLQDVDTESLFDDF